MSEEAGVLEGELVEPEKLVGGRFSVYLSPDRKRIVLALQADGEEEPRRQVIPVTALKMLGRVMPGGSEAMEALDRITKGN